MLLTEQYDKVVDIAYEGVESFGSNVLDYVFFVPSRLVRNEPFQNVFLPTKFT